MNNIRIQLVTPKSSPVKSATSTNLVSKIQQHASNLYQGITKEKISNLVMHQAAVKEFKSTIDEAVSRGTPEEKGKALLTLVKVSRDKDGLLPGNTRIDLAETLWTLNKDNRFNNLSLNCTDCQTLVEQMNYQPNEQLSENQVGLDDLRLTGFKLGATKEQVKKLLIITLERTTKFSWDSSTEDKKNAPGLLKLLNRHQLFRGLNVSDQELSKYDVTDLDLDDMTTDDDCSACTIS
jgi:hypothetical protein